MALARLSLRTQFLLATAAVLFALTATSLLVVRESVDGQIRQQTAESMANSVRAFHREQQEQETQVARTTAMLAELPPLKAVMTSGHAATIQDATAEFWTLSGSDLLVLADPKGRIMAVHSGEPPVSYDNAARLLAASLQRRESASWWQQGPDLFRVIIRPMLAGWGQDQQWLGTIVVGERIDAAVAEDIGNLAGTEVAITANGSIVASSLPAVERGELQHDLHSVGALPRELFIAGRHYEVGATAVSSGPPDIRCLMLLPLDSVYGFRERLNRLLLVLGLLAALVGALVVIWIARAVTSPLDRLVAAVRALGSGDSQYHLEPRGSTEVAELADAFTLMRERLAESQRRQLDAERLAALGRAAGSLSHDLRHHLAALVANAEFLHCAEELGIDRDEVYLEIERASKEMTGLMDALVDISRERMSLTLSQDRLEDIVRRAAAAVRANPEFRQCPIEVTAVCDTTGAFDKRKLERAFFNLLLNAVQATHEGDGRVGVQISCDAAGFLCRVWDQGPGVPEYVRQRLFQPFVSVGKNNGTGLGLAIAGKMIHEHEGTIVIEETSSVGTTFAVRLPRKSTEGQSMKVCA